MPLNLLYIIRHYTLQFSLSLPLNFNFSELNSASCSSIRILNITPFIHLSIKWPLALKYYKDPLEYTNNFLEDKIDYHLSTLVRDLDHFCEDDPIVGRNTFLSSGNTTQADKHMFGSDMRSEVSLEQYKEAREHSLSKA